MRNITKTEFKSHLLDGNISFIHIHKPMNDEIMLAIENYIDNIRLDDILNDDGYFTITRSGVLKRHYADRVSELRLGKGETCYEYIGKHGHRGYIVAGEYYTNVYVMI